jgi:hypothetical protein
MAWRLLAVPRVPRERPAWRRYACDGRLTRVRITPFRPWRRSCWPSSHSPRFASAQTEGGSSRRGWVRASPRRMFGHVHIRVCRPCARRSPRRSRRSRPRRAPRCLAASGGIRRNRGGRRPPSGHGTRTRAICSWRSIGDEEVRADEARAPRLECVIERCGSGAAAHGAPAVPRCRRATRMPQRQCACGIGALHESRHCTTTCACV